MPFNSEGTHSLRTAVSAGLEEGATTDGAVVVDTLSKNSSVMRNPL